MKSILHWKIVYIECEQNNIFNCVEMRRVPDRGEE
jgi:hypothetical protein